MRAAIRLSLLLAWLLAGAPAPSLAQAPEEGDASGTTEAPANGDVDPAAQAREARAAVAAEIESLRDRIRQASEAGTPGPEIGNELELLERIERIWTRRLDMLLRGDQLAASELEAQDRLAAGPATGLDARPPFSLALLDAITLARDAQATSRSRGEARVAELEEALEETKQQGDRAERERRAARDAVEAEADAVAGARLRARLRVAQLESRLAQTQLQNARLELENARRDLAIQRQNESLLARTRDHIAENLALSTLDLVEPLARLDAEREQLERDLEAATREVATADRRLRLAQERIDAIAVPNDEQRAELAARKAGRQAAEQRVVFLQEQIDRLARARELWNRRYRTLSGIADRSELGAWADELTLRLEELRRKRRLANDRLPELAQDIERVGAEASGAPEIEAAWHREQVRRLEQLRAVHRSEVDAVDAHLQLVDRTLSEIRGETSRVTLADRARAVASQVRALWAIELFVVDDNAITLGKILLGLMLLATGFLLASAAARLAGRFVITRLITEQGAAAAIQRLLFYLLLTMVFLVALRSVNIPLTAFAVLGGAIAIGVGFGSQNVINNFISGLILLIERPIKVGDIVDVDGTEGTVELIGPRSTRIRTFDNLHMIVPNSSFLEKNVLNWTLSDDILRCHVDVGVAYGSPTREVERLMRHALESHGQVLKDPRPRILFRDFGNDALIFRAYFWVSLSSGRWKIEIESDVRFRIDRLFREAGVTIAFPQRDVHLDMAGPLPVQMYPPPAGPQSGPQSGSQSGPEPGSDSGG